MAITRSVGTLSPIQRVPITLAPQLNHFFTVLVSLQGVEEHGIVEK